MAVTEMKIGTRSLGGGKLQRQYRIDTVTDESTAMAALLAGTSTTATLSTGTYVRADDECSVEEVTATIYIGTVVWKSKERQPGDCSYSLRISGSNTHITQAKEHIASYPSMATTDYKGAIGVTSDLKVSGCDIIVPEQQIVVTKTLENTTVDAEYWQAVEELAGTTNDDTFTIRGRDYAEGELLLMGADLNQSTENTIDITFTFGYSKNETDLDIGDIEGIAKKGWEYLWVAYSETVDNNELATQPVAVYIERVYDAGDFDTLGICA